jgi:hypothetical protein
MRQTAASRPGRALSLARPTDSLYRAATELAGKLEIHREENHF